MIKFISSILAALAMLTAMPASAAKVYFTSGATNVNGGKQFSGTDGVNVRVTAWSIDGSDTIRNATLQMWSQGLGIDNGVSSGGDGSHTIDNRGWTDFLILQFDTVVELKNGSFQTGWYGSDNKYYNDTDATIGTFSSALPINTAPPILNQNVSVLAPLNLYDSNADSGDSYRAINPGGNVGNVWLIGASFTNLDGRRDGFKLKKLTYHQAPPVPEPGTWLMMILGFGLIGGAMRSRKTVGAMSHA